MALQIQLKTSSVPEKLPLPTDLANGELALNFSADGPFISCKDSSGNVRRVGNIWVGDAPVSNPTVGDGWLDTNSTPSILKIYESDLIGWVDSVTVALATTSAFGIVRLASSADIAAGTIGRVVDASQLLSETSALVSSVSATSPLLVAGTPTQPNLTFTPGLPRQLLQTNGSGTGVEFASNIDVPGTLDVTGIGTFDSDVVVQGDLTVNGTMTTINTEVITSADKNIELGAVETPTDATANGGGITLLGATNKTIQWFDSTDSWTLSENLDLASGKSYRINNVEVLSSSALGASVGVSTSNITSGTLGVARGGTGISSYAKGDLVAGNASTGLTVLGVGSNGQRLTADSSQPLGVKWETPTVYVSSVSSTTAALSVVNGTTTPSLSIRSATTSVDGIVLLSTSTSSTSTTNAATSSAVKAAYDLAAAALPSAGGSVTGDLLFGAGAKIVFEGATANDFETTLYVADPTADRAINLPDSDGTIALTSNLDDGTF